MNILVTLIIIVGILVVLLTIGSDIITKSKQDIDISYIYDDAYTDLFSLKQECKDDYIKSKYFDIMISMLTQLETNTIDIDAIHKMLDKIK